MNSTTIQAALQSLPDNWSLTVPVLALRTLVGGNDAGLLTVEDIARLTRRGAGAVRKWIRDGQLRATLVGRSYLIERENFDLFLGRQPERVLTPSRSELTAEETALDVSAWRAGGASRRASHSPTLYSATRTESR